MFANILFISAETLDQNKATDDESRNNINDHNN